jgi:glycogen debranching enzyme
MKLLNRTTWLPSSGRKLKLLLVSLGLGGAVWRIAKYIRKILQQPTHSFEAFQFIESDLTDVEDRGVLIAVANLLSGIERRKIPGYKEKLVVCAGRKNFREPWARDLSFASFGLVELQRADVLKDSFDVFLMNQLQDGQLPIKVHSINIPDRYLHSVFRREQPVIAPLRPKYRSGHGTFSLDGNALLIIAIIHYSKSLDDHDFLSDNWEALKRALNWLKKNAPDEDGLLHQEPYSDWADSIARSGKVLYTNVIYWKALIEMAEAAGLLKNTLDRDRYLSRTHQVAQAINANFWRPDLGYYVTNFQFDNLSSCGNLMAIAWGLTSEEQSVKIFDMMDKFGMAEPVPTKVAYPPYPNRYIAIENRLGRIGFYHGDAAWLWLGAWNIIALTRRGRKEHAGELLRRIMNVVVRDGMVHEVYDSTGNYVSSFWYTSDAPFTWSSGMIVYAYQEYQRSLSLTV